jgi:superfamily II RNA helicase
MKPLLSWATGGALSTICADYELYEGNVVKAILKAAGILTELHALAMYTQNLEMLEVLREFTIVRDVVVPNSLYLTI